MAFERLRAHGAAVGTIAVVTLAGVSVTALLLAEGRLERYDPDRPAPAATGSLLATPATTEPAPATTDPAPLTTTSTPTVVPGPPSGLLAEVFESMNADRSANGLAPLAWDDRLSASAQHATDEMAASGLVAPQDLDALLAVGFTRAAQNMLTG